MSKKKDCCKKKECLNILGYKNLEYNEFYNNKFMDDGKQIACIICTKGIDNKKQNALWTGNTYKWYYIKKIKSKVNKEQWFKRIKSGKIGSVKNEYNRWAQYKTGKIWDLTTLKISSISTKNGEFALFIEYLLIWLIGCEGSGRDKYMGKINHLYLKENYCGITININKRHKDKIKSILKSKNARFIKCAEAFMHCMGYEGSEYSKNNNRIKHIDSKAIRK